MSLRSKTGNSLVKGIIVFAICAFGSVGLLLLSDKAVNNAFSVSLNFINKLNKPESPNKTELRANAIKHISTIESKVWPVEANLAKVKPIKKINKQKTPNSNKNIILKMSTPVNVTNNTVLPVKKLVEVKAQISKPDIEIIEQHKILVKPVEENITPEKEPVIVKSMSPIIVTHMIVSKSSGKELFSADIPATSTQSNTSNYAQSLNPINNIATEIPIIEGN